jgi:plasmid stability protein
MMQDQSEWRTLSVRVPPNIATLLEAEAARNDRSMSAEVAHMLRTRLDNEQKKKTG